MTELETVRVKYRKGKGEGIINAGDFDPELHELLEGEIESSAPAPVEPPSPPEPPEEGGEDEKMAEGSGGEEPQEKPLSELHRGELVARLEAAGGDLATVEGSGQNGAVKNDDIVTAIEKLEAEKAEAPPEEGGVE